MAAVHKYIAMKTVAVQITEQSDAGLEGAHALLQMIHGREEAFNGIRPFPIQIPSREIDACITVNDAVGIEHWNDFEYKVLP